MFVLIRDIPQPEQLVAFWCLGAFAVLIKCRKSFHARLASFVLVKCIFWTLIAEVSAKSRYQGISIVGQNATYRREPEVINVNSHFAGSPNVSDTFLLRTGRWHNICISNCKVCLELKEVISRSLGRGHFKCGTCKSVLGELIFGSVWAAACAWLIFLFLLRIWYCNIKLCSLPF